jgi:radical SAM protein with 4Fe4S-binding SPASM domain
LRRVPGTFDLTMAALRTCEDLGLPVQVNTLVTSTTREDLPAVYELLTTQPIMRWSLFFLISMGRGAGLQEVTPGEAERLHAWLYELSKDAPFQVKTTEAMSYRRVAIRRARASGCTDAEIMRSPLGRGLGIRDGNGIMFINYRGEVHPSGFLPYRAGDVRSEDVVDIYRTGEVFTALRDVSRFKGRCGRCDYAKVCGGSRARAYAWTGDLLAEDPLCPYHPKEGAAVFGTAEAR